MPAARNLKHLTHQKTFDADIAVVETDHLRNFPDSMAVVVQMMTTHISNTMAKGKTNKPDLLAFDEAMKTLKNPIALKLVDKVTRIVRKHEASATRWWPC